MLSKFSVKVLPNMLYWIQDFGLPMAVTWFLVIPSSPLLLCLYDIALHLLEKGRYSCQHDWFQIKVVVLSLMFDSFWTIQPLVNKNQLRFPSKPDNTPHHYSNPSTFHSYLQTFNLLSLILFSKHKPVLNSNIGRIYWPNYRIYLT